MFIVFFFILSKYKTYKLHLAAFFPLKFFLLYFPFSLKLIDRKYSILAQSVIFEIYFPILRKKTITDKLCPVLYRKIIKIKSKGNCLEEMGIHYVAVSKVITDQHVHNFIALTAKGS
jgi:hypothetical protein